MRWPRTDPSEVATSARHTLAALALAPVLAFPGAARATTHDDPGVPPRKAHFDLQAHRGGIGMTTEESLEGFGKAMRLGVSTLELDTQITKDEKVVVNHDRQVSAQKCRDTAPATPGTRCIRTSGSTSRT